MKKKIIRCPKCGGLAIPIGDNSGWLNDYLCISEKMRCGFRFRRGD